MSFGPHQVTIVFFVVTANQLFELLLRNFELRRVCRVRSRLRTP